MNGNDKLFSFLLIDPKILEDVIMFEEYTTEIKYNMYKSLVDQYSRCLEFLKIYKGKREKQIEYIKKEIDDKQSKIADYQQQINEIKEEFGISDDIVKHYVRNYTDEKTRMDTMLISSIENDEKMVSAFQKINVLGVNILILENQVSLLEEACINYNYSYEMINVIERTFYNSYGFRAKFNDGKWVSEQQKFLDELELRFQLEWKLAEDRRGMGNLLESEASAFEEADNGEDLQIDGVDVNKVFGLGNGSAFEKVEIESWSDVDSLIIEWYDTLKLYCNKANLSHYEKGSKIYDSVEKHYSSEKILDDIKKHIEQTDKEERYDDIVELLYASGNSGFRQAYYTAIMNLYQYLVSVKDGLYSKYMVGDKDYRDLVKDIEKLKNALDRYDDNRVSKQIKYNSTKEKISDRENRRIRKEEQKQALREIIGIVLRLKKNRKRKSAKTIARKLYRMEEEEGQLKKQGYDINVELYKQFFAYLKSDVKRANSEFVKKCLDMKRTDKKLNKVDIGEIILQNMDMFTVTVSPFRHHMKRKNKLYYYGSLGIITLNFYNTDIPEYKTAALIVDAEDIEHLIIPSSRLAWTFKNGKRCSTEEYGKKTYKADIVTADKGSINICNKIMGQMERQGIRYVTNSHKFDLRKQNLHAVVVRSRKQKFNEELYYNGKLRIEQKGDMVADNTVCFNCAENVKGASILYFNDRNKFIEFLDELTM